MITIAIIIFWLFCFGIAFSATYSEFDSVKHIVINLILSIIFAPLVAGFAIGKMTRI